MPTRAAFPPARNRGPAAFGRSDSSIWLSQRHSEVSPAVTRLQVHSVTDETNQTYLRVVRAAIAAIERGVDNGRWPAPNSSRELDSILAAVCDNVVYGEPHVNRNFAPLLHAAWQHVFPGMVDHMPNFERSVVGARRLHAHDEGFGMCEERWAAIAATMFQRAQTPAEREAATWWVLQKDLIARSQDLELLRKCDSDIQVLREARGGRLRIALFFGIAERGETVKTSTRMPNQGTEIDQEWIAELVLELYERRPHGEHLFSVSREFVWQQVESACNHLGISTDGWGLHRLRHTGAAVALYSNRLTLTEVQRRGRWLAPKSVERYTKVAHVLADLAKLNPALRDLGTYFLRDPRNFIPKRAPRRVVFS